MWRRAKAFEIEPAELVRQVEAGEPLHILDVRAEERLASGSVDIVEPSRFHNLRGSQVLASERPEELGLDRDSPLAVVCGLGKDSLKVARHLSSLGFQARSLRGGLTEWMGSLIPRELDPGPHLDRLIQLDRVGKGALGYLLASGGEAVVVDPPRRFETYLELVRQHRLKVWAVVDTHAHADYISGGLELAARLRALYFLHPADNVYPYDGSPGRLSHHPLTEGTTLRFGSAALTAHETPGHTEGSVTLRLGDDIALTGDFLFVHSVGRPDLGGKTAEWTETLFRSLERARQDWPPSLRIYPAHYADESERSPDHTVGRTLAELLESNEPLGIRTPQGLQEWMAVRVRPFPDAYREIKAINIGLQEADRARADELEAGRNQCALG